MTAEYILGEEVFEIRTLSARQYLSAKAVAYGALDEELDDTETAKWAAVASNCLYKNGKRAFGSIDEVLDALTFEQISCFGKAYGCLENATAGTLVVQSEERTENEPSDKRQTVYKNSYIYSFPTVASVFSLEDFSDAVQMESLRRFHNIGGDLFDR